MLDETRRQELREEIRAFRNSGMPAAELLAAVRQLAHSGKSADTLLSAKTLQNSADDLISTAGAKRIKAFFVRSVTIEPILPYLTVEAALSGFVLDVEMGGYGSYMDEMLNPAGPLAAGSDVDLALVVLDLEDAAGRLPDLCASGRGEGVAEEISECVERIGAMLTSLRSRHRCRILVQGFVVPADTALGSVGEANLAGGLQSAVRQLNRELSARCATVADCMFFSVDDIAAGFGKSAWQDRRLFLSSRLAIAPAAFPVYVRGIVRSMAAFFRPMRKVLCTDLDNTLWGGILGEDGPEGIATGSAFPGNCYLEYQRYLKRLRARGVLLAAVSKNNASDVEEVFSLRADDLALKLDDFVARKISWNEKADALRELAKELSLGLDSFVFVDDNPVECEAIRQNLPEVAVIAAPVEEPWRMVPLLEEQGFFDTATVTEDDLQRSDEYRSQAARESLLQAVGDRDQFLQSLDIVCTFLPATQAPLARSVQLLAKTNQFNLTTRRHSAADVERFDSEAGGQAIVVRVKDRFGDAGVVGLLLAETRGDTCRIDSFLLSCRVIGRGIESALLAEAAQQAERDGARWLLGEYRKSKKNAPCATFYADHKFVDVMPEGAPTPDTSNDAEESQWYWYDLSLGVPEMPSWLTRKGETHELTGSTVSA